MLGVYEKSDDKEKFLLTTSAQKFDDNINGKLVSTINMYLNDTHFDMIITIFGGNSILSFISVLVPSRKANVAFSTI